MGGYIPHMTINFFSETPIVTHLFLSEVIGSQSFWLSDLSFLAQTSHWHSSIDEPLWE